jgi:hypothetical protein
MKMLAITMAVFLFANLSAAAERKWPDLTVPKGSRLVIVGDNLIVNGNETRTWELHVPLSSEDAIAFYQKAWAQPAIPDLPGYSIDETEDWNVISRINKEFFITVQLSDSGRNSCSGYFSIAKLPKSKRAFVLGKGFNLPPGSTVINDVSAIDGPKKSRTIIAVNDRSVPNNANYFRNEYAKQGWKELKKSVGENNTNKEALLFDKSGQEFNVALVNQGRSTYVVAVEVNN